MGISEILGIVDPISFVYQVSQDYSKARAGYRKHFDYIWEQSANLDPEIFFENRFKYYNGYYFPRDEDRKIEDAINDQKNVLILGRPLVGKSRAAFEVLKKFEKSCFILKPRPVDIEIENYIFPRLSGNMKKVMFLDDLDIFAGTENFHYLFEVARKNKLIIVATCRSGFKYDFLEKMLPHNLTIESIFDKVVTYDKVPKSQAHLIASKLDINWKEAEFDGTIGSLLMKLGPMKTRYKDLPQNEKDLLRILKRLYCAGIAEDGQLFFVDTIQTFAKVKGIISNTNDLNCLLESLISKEFIENPMENVYQVEEMYLERVFDFGVKTQRISIFNDMIDIFSGKHDILFKVGVKAYSIGHVKPEKSTYMEVAITAYQEALKVYTFDEFPIQYATTQNNLGNVYVELAAVDDKKDNLIKAIEAYKAALKFRTLDKLPIDYARSQNNLGNAFQHLAMIEDKEVNLIEAISAYENALNILTPDNLPTDYSDAQSNLGLAYQKLASVDDKKNNLLKAIEAYEKALNILTSDKLSLYYAQTISNLGIAYRNLAEVDDKKNNLLKAIDIYDEVLKIFTSHELPFYCALTQNNLGVAYRNLASIDDKKNNLHKAIKAYDKSLQILTHDKLPQDCALTQNNLGNVYAELATVEDKKDNLNKAIEAYEEALNIFTPDKLPLDYANTQNNLGNVYAELAVVEDKKDNLNKAIEAYEEALNIFKRENMEDRAEPLRQILSTLQSQLQQT